MYFHVIIGKVLLRPVSYSKMTRFYWNFMSAFPEILMNPEIFLATWRNQSKNEGKRRDSFIWHYRSKYIALLVEILKFIFLNIHTGATRKSQLWRVLKQICYQDM